MNIFNLGIANRSKRSFEFGKRVSADQLLIPLELGGKQGKLVVEVAHRNPKAVIYWHLNEQYLGESMGIHSKSIQPQVGKHTLSLVDDEGNVFVKVIEVVD